MTKERLTVEIDAELVERLRAACIDPQAYIESLLRRAGAVGESPAQKAEREKALREEMAPGLKAYDDLIEKYGLWSDGLRQF
jgi:hypothetical protein